MPSAPPSDLLKAISAIVDENKPDPKATPPKEGAGFVKAAAVTMLVIFAIAVWTFVDWWRNRELAKLRHEKTVARVKEDQATTDQAVAQAAADKAILGLQATQAREQQAKLEAEIAVLEARRAADQEAIDRIRSWNDVAHN